MDGGIGIVGFEAEVVVGEVEDGFDFGVYDHAG